MPPQKEIDGVYIWEPRKASVSVLFDRSTDREKFRQLNYEHEARSVAVRRRAGTVSHVLSWPERVLQQHWQCLVDERLVCHGGKAFTQEIRTYDTIS
jgi:hypothetical protein